MRRFIIGTLALFGALIFAFVIEGGNPGDFILPTPLIIVVCVPIFAGLAVWSLKDWALAWKDAFAKGSESASAQASIKLWDFYEKACYIAGVVGFMLGLNIIGSNADVLSRLGRSLAVDCIAPILAILFAMVARILKARVENGRA